MSVSDPLAMRVEIERRILNRTGHRVRNLAVEVLPERVVLHGLAATYYLKQLAQHGVFEFLPHVRLENSIVVDYSLGYWPEVGLN